LAALGEPSSVGRSNIVVLEVLLKVSLTTVVAARATPLANSRPTAIVLNNSMVRLISETAFL